MACSEGATSTMVSQFSSKGKALARFARGCASSIAFAFQASLPQPPVSHSFSKRRRPSGLVYTALIHFSRSLDPGIDTPCGAVSRRQQGREDQFRRLHRRRSQPCFHFTFGAPLAHFVTSRAFHTPLQSLNDGPDSTSNRTPSFSSFLVKRIHSFPPNNLGNTATPKRAIAACVRWDLDSWTNGRDQLLAGRDSIF
ncbi:hypothetical protein B0I37DRAFT_50924 [Chaetomium sp. MPI-CAGE-AT-0009]|nr:hypothetical protein B0I37DRAFT_50924 [Chaetomium sp. MPI-CAGE-AT-0009]